MLIEKFKGLIDFYFVLLTLVLAFVLFFIDANDLKKKGLKKERKIVVGLSIALAVIGPLTYIISIIL
ncbi:hypothetical protein GOQ27_01030 [Clostridium sp. D2Q-11]|uniref:Uncharacterized protein n=1 Tax=Anaeromonas frigoriresistens TaxID=2683708 RepID=A0A942Z796_9FIRM|nr:CLC_0170 family protein [Anaeromonas frigoriresistens]MBS4537023.1 hypothetical protein [Anaeromonas frigoriresistens]